jgi:hypothetical protein
MRFEPVVSRLEKVISDSDFFLCVATLAFAAFNVNNNVMSLLRIGPFDAAELSLLLHSLL